MSVSRPFPPVSDVSPQMMTCATTEDVVLRRACAAILEAVGAVMFMAIACTLASCAVADAPSPANGPRAIDASNTFVHFVDLEPADTELELEEAERFTDLKLGVFSRTWLPRTNT
jgi:hypothetical protein